MSATFKACLILSIVLISIFSFARTQTKPVIVAYVFKKNVVIQPGEINARQLTRINYAFANIQDGRIVTGYPADEQNFAALNALKRDNPELTVLVSVGGWLWSGKFSDMALTKQSRATFIQSAVEFLTRYNLDGLDVDWEYPGLPGAEGNVFRPEDKQNFTLLLKELRQSFDREQKRLNRRLYLTIATGAFTKFIDATEMGKVQKYVDTVNLMSYDYYTPGSFPLTGHNAPLFANPADPKQASADRSVREFLYAGVPASKLVVGVPFYGHAWREVPTQNNGLFQPGKPAPETYTRFHEISANLLANGYQRFWDSTANVPYLYNAATQSFISYEDTESLALKCNYIREHQLAGVMFWDYASDNTGKLLETINKVLATSPN